jgi:hypothetical protein
MEIGYIGLSKLGHCNLQYKTIIVHMIDSILSRIMMKNIHEFPLVGLSFNKINLKLSNIDGVSGQENGSLSLHAHFSSCSNRENKGGVFKCSAMNSSVIIEFPGVLKKEQVMFWIQVQNNKFGIPIISWLRPHNMTIYPNPMHETNPVIYEFTPSHGKANQAMWIHGKNFSSKTVRVMIGDENAVVYFNTDTLLKCIIPKSAANKCSVQVANTNIFTTSVNEFLYIH